MGRTSNIMKLDVGFSRKPGDTTGYPIVCYDGRGRRPFDVHAAYYILMQTPFEWLVLL